MDGPLRFNHSTANLISHGFARLIAQAVQTTPTTYRGLVAAAERRSGESDATGPHLSA